MREKELYPKVIDLFTSLGYSKIEREYQIFKTLKTAKKVDLVFINPTKKTSVEVKIHDWKNALFQAYVNSFFFNESYVAIPEKIVKKINIDMFKHYHVGIISVNRKTAKVVLESGESLW